ncbi:SDR family oxidoreductase [Candidatus Dojkabacteria bacterium]|nr:SDR family oxidoreductase [Candidatus Dojkabacteria bacterium]
MIKLKDKSILITGGSSGIGKAVALRCAKDGAKVLVAARDEEKLSKVVDEINSLGGKGFYFKVDVTQPDQVKKMFENAIENLGCVDVVFNNAGLGFVKRIYEITDDEIAKTIDVNVKGEIYVAKYASQIFKEQKNGHLINTSSLAGLITIPQWSVYVASKWAITGLTDAIRQELKPFGIKVSSLHPGAVNTAFFSKDKANIDISQMDSSQVVTPEIVAEAVYKAIFTNTRKILVPSMSKSYSFLYKFMPELTEKMMENLVKDVAYEDEPEESSFGYVKPCPRCSA